MNKQDQLVGLNNFLEELREFRGIIIVEGKKDQQALKNFNISSKTLSKPLFEFIEEIDCEECIILTDFDSEGKKLYARLSHQLQKRKIKINNKFRNFLFKDTRLSHIEGLTNYIKNLQNF